VRGDGFKIQVRVDPLIATELTPPFARPVSRTAIRRAASYAADLESVLSETLAEFNLPIEKKRILLKPNFVAPDPEGIVNTHPAVVMAAYESFRRLGASEVRIGDGAALERDAEAILESMHARHHLGQCLESFVDLNTDEVRRVPLRTHASALKELWLPRTILEADFVVSMPKLKTHHWAGVTLSLKNMFGIVPGGCYGWPKNILHWAGITRALLDLTSTVRPNFTIVDGIIGMEGNGPIQGTPKPCGVLVLGDDPVAVDATCARIMGVIPERVEHLAKAAHLLGHIREDRIQQIGESISAVHTRFSLIDSFFHLQAKVDGTHRA
jgi:uncharacterized protein (DUF362 family)